MKKTSPISEKLIAPCGMNCAICSCYLSYANNLKRSKCIGCRPTLPGKINSNKASISKNRNCRLIKKNCKGIKNISKGIISFCFKCSQYPCEQLNRLDKRYKNNYGMSMIDNLDFISNNGITNFIKYQYKKYACSKCGNLISIHNKKCFKCDTITKLIDKKA